mgnify:CR=1 FL=1
MKRPVFTGLCTALVTPFRGDGVNYEMLEALIERQIRSGADAIVLAGTTGESPTLTDAEKLEIFRVGVNTAAGRTKIIAGTGSNSTAKAVDLSAKAARMGVDAILAVTPYYNKSTQPGLIQYYTAVAAASGLPVIAYNVPSRTGVDIRVDTCRKLAEIPGIAGIKEASGDISKIGRMIAACGDALPVYSGNDDQTVPIMALGGAGVISVASNVVPGPMKELTDMCLAGEYPKAAAIQRKLLKLMDLMFCQVNPIPVKAAMELIGFDCGSCRPPLDGLPDADVQKLRDCLDELELLAYNN